MDKQIVISIRALIFAFLLVIGAYIVYKLGPVLGILLISTLIVISIEPMVKYFMGGTLLNKSVSRGLAVILSYLIVISVLLMVITVGFPPFISQAQKLLKNLTVVAASLQLTDQVDIKLPDLLPQASNFSGSVVAATLSLFSNLTTLFSILIISLYMSLDWQNIKRRFQSIFPENFSETVADTIAEIETNVGHWIKGQLILMVIVGFLSFIGLLILDVDYPLALGLISGLLEVVPMIGPIIAAILAAVIAFVDAPIKGVGVIALFVIIQQLENNILVPKVMQRVSGFSPLVILLALLVGSEFFGVLGAVMAVPITMISAIVLKKFLGYRG